MTRAMMRAMNSREIVESISSALRIIHHFSSFPRAARESLPRIHVDAELEAVEKTRIRQGRIPPSKIRVLAPAAISVIPRELDPKLSI